MNEYRIGILPAAGKATRFGGMMKELLPIGPSMSLLCYAYFRLMEEVDQIVLVTSHRRLQAHVTEMGYHVFYTIQSGTKDIYSAMIEGCRIQADRYYFMMPDTLVEGRFPEKPKADFIIGTFETETPERFGCFVNDNILNKSTVVPKPAKAWGTLIWSDYVYRYWLTQKIESYTHAINLAMDKFGYETYELESYVDFASYEDYKNYMKGGTT